MTDTPPDTPAPQATGPAGHRSLARLRDDRRKAALKANMARRKAQLRARQSAADPQADSDSEINTNNDTRTE